MDLTRRDLGKIAMAAAGLSIADMARATQSSKIGYAQIGTITYSFMSTTSERHVAAPDMPAANAEDWPQ